MLNKYFIADGNIDFMYANAALQNIYFAEISLNNILYSNDFEIGIYHSEHTYYFYYIQNLLTACGNISNIFYNSGFNAKKETTERCKRLRQMFNINRNKYPLTFQKEVRNTNEHFDERYEQFNGNLGDYNLLDSKTNPEMRRIILEHNHLRTYDKDSGIYYTFNRKKEKISYNLYELHSELSNMLEAIFAHPALNEAWVEEKPGDILLK